MGFFWIVKLLKKLSKDCSVSMAQVSVDGMPEYHNITRALANGKPTFDTIINNIEVAKEFLKIVVRVNVNNNNMQNIEKLKELFISKKDWTNNPLVYFARIRDYNTCSYEKSCFIREDDFSDFEFQITKDSYCRDGDINRVYPNKRNVFCSAQCTNNYVVDPDGNCYTCWNDVGIVHKSIGNVRFGLNSNDNYLKWILYQESPRCKKCKFLPICLGGCPHEYLESNEPECLSWVLNYKNNLMLAYEDHMEAKKAL